MVLVEQNSIPLLQLVFSKLNSATSSCLPFNLKETRRAPRPPQVNDPGDAAPEEIVTTSILCIKIMPIFTGKGSKYRNHLIPVIYSLWRLWSSQLPCKVFHLVAKRKPVRSLANTNNRCRQRWQSVNKTPAEKCFRLMLSMSTLR